MSSSLPPGHQNAGGQYHNPAAHPSSGSSSANHQNYAKITREVLSKMEKVPAELVALTYGSLITQLLQDFNSDIAQVNDELDRMGEQIGGRLVDEFLSKTANIMSVFPVCCQDFRELCELVGSVGFKMYLGVAAEVTNWSPDFTACDFILKENPLNEFVELPAALQKGTPSSNLWYSNLLAGAVRGALAAVSIKAHVFFVEDALRDDNEVTRIRCELVEYVLDEFDG